jgi:cell division protease FtsH
MSETLGTMVYEDNEQDSYMGRMSSRTVSEATQQKVDAEIRSILDQQYALSRRLLEENRDKVEVMAKALLDWETIDADQINDIMAGEPPRPPKSEQAKPAANDGDASGDVTPNAPAPA